MLDLKITCTECGAENSVNETISATLRDEMFAEFQQQLENSQRDQSMTHQLRAEELDAQEAALQKRSEELDSEVEQKLLAFRVNDQNIIDHKAKSMAERQINLACKQRDDEIELLQKQVEKLTTDGIELAKLQREHNSSEQSHELEKRSSGQNFKRKTSESRTEFAKLRTMSGEKFSSSKR